MTPRGPGRDRAQRDLAGLDPSSLLTAAEAARRVGVPRGELEAMLDAGTLLHEVGRRRGKEVRLVRVVDLVDAFGADEGGAAGTAGPDATSTGAATTDEDPAAAPESREPHAPGAAQSEERAVAVPEARLAPLLEELRARLEEAEQERRASTAGLVMAQRRLVALEEAARARPLHRRAGVWGGAAACCVVGLLWFDLAGRLGRTTRAAERGRTELEVTAAGIERSVGGVDARMVALDGALREELGTLGASSEAALEEARAARRLAEERAAAEADARRAELARSERERAALTARLEDLRRDAESARSALELERDASGRERARFALRLDEAERGLERARLALEEERRLAQDERGASEARLRELTAQRRAEGEALAATLSGLESEFAQRSEELRSSAEAAREAAAAAAAAAQAAADEAARPPAPTGGADPASAGQPGAAGSLARVLDWWRRLLLR